MSHTLVSTHTRTVKPSAIILPILMFLLCVDLCLIHNTSDLDIWARMAVGRLFFEQGHLSYHDVFSYTATKTPWVDHEWGSGVIFYMSARSFGAQGLLVLRMFLYFGTVFWIYLSIKERMQYAPGLLFSALLAWFVLPGFLVTIRSQAFTYFFFSLWIYLLERSRKGSPTGLILLPMTTVIWANLHGGFLAGLGLLLVYGTGELLNKRPCGRYFVLFLVCASLTLLNPYGVRYWAYLYHATTMSRSLITEWRPLNLLGPVRAWLGFKLCFPLALLFLTLQTLKRIRADWVDIALMSITGCLSLLHARHTTFFLIGCAPFLYCSYKRLFRGFPKRTATSDTTPAVHQRGWFHGMVYGSLHGLALAVAILLAASLPARVEVSPHIFPVHAIRFIKHNDLEGNLLIPFDWGSYAIWELYPQCKVSMDGRYEEVYDTGTFLDNYRFFTGLGGWEEALTKHRPDIILTRRTSSICKKLQQTERWVPVYQDTLCALYLPRGHPRRLWLLPEEQKRIQDPFSVGGHSTFIR